MHPLKLLMHRFQLPLNVIALGKATQRSQCKLQMVLGIDQQAAMQAAGFVAHDNTTSHPIQRQPRLEKQGHLSHGGDRSRKHNPLPDPPYTDRIPLAGINAQA